MKDHDLIKLPYIRNRIFNSQYYHSWEVVHRPDFIFNIKLRPSIVKELYILGNDRIFGTAIGTFHFELDARIGRINDYQSAPPMDELEQMYGDYYEHFVMPMICHVPLDVRHNAERLNANMFVKKPDFISEDNLFETASEVANCNDWIEELQMHHMQDGILRYIDYATPNDLILCRPFLSEEHAVIEDKHHEKVLH